MFFKLVFGVKLDQSPQLQHWFDWDKQKVSMMWFITSMDAITTVCVQCVVNTRENHSHTTWSSCSSRGRAHMRSRQLDHSSCLDHSQLPKISIVGTILFNPFLLDYLMSLGSEWYLFIDYWIDIYKLSTLFHMNDSHWSKW